MNTLLIVMQLVQLMGGRIWVESEEGKGTQFHFTMVLNAAEDQAQDSQASGLLHESALESKKCMVIEHSSIVRNLLVREIGTFGLHAMAAVDFDAARTCIRLNRFAVILVDGTIPECDSFVKEISKTAPTSRIMVTASPGTASQVSGANVITTLVKPIRRWRLFKALQTALSGSSKNYLDEEELSIKESRRQVLANLAFRHPLRILVMLFTVRPTDDSSLRTIPSTPGLHYNI